MIANLEKWKQGFCDEQEADVREAQDPFPDVLRIEPVGKCNFRCIHCPTGNKPNNRAILGRDRFALILDRWAASDFVPRVVVLYHGGEPLLNRDLGHYVCTLKELGVRKTVITTNASLLNEKRSLELILAGLDEMKVSFDGESADENNMIRRNGDFYRNASNVKTLLKLRKRLGRSNPNVIISNVRICDTGMPAQFKPKNGRSSLVFQDPPAYLARFFQDEKGEVEFKSYPAMIWPGFEEFEKFEKAYLQSEKPDYCCALFESFTILSNGDVVPCCYDLHGKWILGNVFEKNVNMFDIWNGREFATIRENFRKQIYHELCAHCTIVAPCFLCKREASRFSRDVAGEQRRPAVA